MSEEQNGNPVIKAIARIAEVLKGSKLEKAELLSIERELEEVTAFLQCTPRQAVVLIGFLYLEMQGDLPSTQNLYDFFQVTRFRMLRIGQDLKYLVHRRLLFSDVRPDAEDKLQWIYTLPEEVKEKIICGVTGAPLE